MKMKLFTPLFLIGISLTIFCHQGIAHHSAFSGVIYEAVVEADLEAMKGLMSESVLLGTQGTVSLAQLKEKLQSGLLVPFNKASEHKIQVYASNDTFDSRLRCVVAFKLKFDDDNVKDEPIYLLAKRIGDDGYRNPKAWRIWRIVTDHSQAECFLGEKIDS